MCRDVPIRPGLCVKKVNGVLFFKLTLSTNEICKQLQRFS